MRALGLMRRTVVAACSALGLFAAVACQDAVAQSDLLIRNIRIDVAPLRASVGEPTASWVQQGAPDQLARVLAGRMKPQGGTLVVRIDSVTLGPLKDGSAWDNISGVAMIGSRQWPVRATARYHLAAVDQVLFEQSNHRRVTELVQALAYWLARDL